MSFSCIIIPLVCCGFCAFAQSPSPAPTAGGEALVNALAPADIEEAMRALKSNFVNPETLKGEEINRATLQGLLGRLRGGAVLLPAAPAPEPTAPFYSDVLANRIGYARLGSLSPQNAGELNKALENFGTRKVDALVLDLRASSAAAQFDVAAELASRFVAKGKALWTIHKTVARQDRPFTNEREPAFQGTMMVLIDSDTSGAAEALAAALKSNGQTMLIGETTAGRAVEYQDFPLSNGKILRVAVAEVLGPDGHSLFPNGVKPDLPVEFSLAEKRQIFLQSAQRGMAPFVFEPERPHLNEASLIAGTNPELDNAQARRAAGEGNLHDAVVQRAVDVITSLAVFQKR